MSLLTVGGLAPGDWATWAVAAASFLAFAGVIASLVVEGWRRRADNERRHNDDISAQARRVGAYLISSADENGFLEGPGGLRMTLMVMRVVNASELPVRRVQGHLNHPGEQVTARFETLVAIEPNETTDVSLPVTDEGEYELLLEFDDDAGIRWSKYGPTGLTQVS